MANTRDAVVAMARSKRGVSEQPPNSNRTEFGRWYGFDGVYWCAIFLSWVVAMVGNKSGYRFASTAASVAWARRNGRLRSVRDARPGDIVVKLYTPTSGHTGIVVANEGANLLTVEGNTGGSDRDGGAVMERRRSTSFWGYCIGLDYDGSESTPPTSPPSSPPVGSSRQGGGLAVDGDFGPSTVKALQDALNRTGSHVTVDGDYGNATKRALQGRLNYTNGPVAIDGQIGPATIKALQKHVGASVDGGWGPNTTRKLQEALNAGRF